MDRKTFGFLVAAAVANLVAQTAARGEAKVQDPKPAGKCVHSCAGYANCKGNGNASCKGHNSCANEGLVPKVCSEKKAVEACKGVKDAKGNTMCSWYD